MLEYLCVKHQTPTTSAAKSIIKYNNLTTLRHFQYIENSGYVTNYGLFKKVNFLLTPFCVFPEKVRYQAVLQQLVKHSKYHGYDIKFFFEKRHLQIRCYPQPEKYGICGISFDYQTFDHQLYVSKCKTPDVFINYMTKLLTKIQEHQKSQQMTHLQMEYTHTLSNTLQISLCEIGLALEKFNMITYLHIFLPNRLSISPIGFMDTF